MVERLKETIKETAEEIRADRKRLQELLVSLKTSTSGDVVNEKLLDKLSNMTHDDDVINNMAEYIVLVLTNLSTIKSNKEQDMLEEFIKVLTHDLESLEKVESCVVVFEQRLVTHTGRRRTDHDNDNEVKESFIKRVLLHNAFGNTIMWVIFLVLVVTGVSVYNSDALDYLTKLITTIKG